MMSRRYCAKSSQTLKAHNRGFQSVKLSSSLTQSARALSIYRCLLPLWREAFKSKLIVFATKHNAIDHNKSLRVQYIYPARKRKQLATITHIKLLLLLRHRKCVQRLLCKHDCRSTFSNSVENTTYQKVNSPAGLLSADYV